MILETTALIDLLRNNREVILKLTELINRNIPLFITSISIFEVWQGTRNLPESKKYRIDQLLDSINNLNFDKSSAKEAGLIQAQLKNQGIVIDPEDVMIAGIAKVNDESILTRNLKHFNTIIGLNAVPY